MVTQFVVGIKSTFILGMASIIVFHINSAEEKKQRKDPMRSILSNLVQNKIKL